MLVNDNTNNSVYNYISYNFLSTFYLGDAMPIFEDSTCPEDNGDICISVVFPSLIEDLLILTQVKDTSIYEGYLRDDDEVSAVLIDTPLTKKRMVNINCMVL